MAIEKTVDSSAGPCANMYGACLGQMDKALKASEPMLKAASQMQLEWLHLGLQRSRAWAALPAALGRCKSPVDTAILQFQFWQTMALNYTESMHRMCHAMSGLSLQQDAPSRARPTRDVLEVREPAASGEATSRAAA